MNTLLYSFAGIILLIGISFLFSYFSYRRNTKWEKRLQAIRRATTHRRPELIKS
jgi:hypothetical protein